MFDLTDEEPGSDVGVDLAEHGNKRAGRELVELGRPVGRPEQWIHPAGGFDPAADVERVGLVESGACEVGGPVDVPGVARGVRRFEQERGVVDARGTADVRYRVGPEQGAFVRGECRFERVAFLCVPAGGNQPMQRRGRHSGAVPVVGELGDPVDADAELRMIGERFGDGVVQIDPLVGKGVVDDGLS